MKKVVFGFLTACGILSVVPANALPAHCATGDDDTCTVCESGYTLNNGACVVSEIKIATTKFVEGEFEPVETKLAAAIDIVDNVVENTIAQASDINDLQADKQTRPAVGCPDGKKCLLVKDANQNNKWYEIIDCGETLPSFGTYSSLNVAYGAGEPWGFSVPGQTGDKLMCRSEVTAIACNDNEWVTPYSNALVYGTARRVGIVEQTPGTVVKLPTNVQSGNVCVCKATRYRMYTGDLSVQSPAAVIGDSQSISTDDWFVAGVVSNDEGCFNMCGADAHHGSSVSKLSYLAGISNACMAAANTAQMCVYHTFFDTVAGFNSVTGSFYVGAVEANGTRWAACDLQSGELLDTSNRCIGQVDGRSTWAVKYWSTSGHSGNPLGYVYGVAGYVNVPEGTDTGDVVDVNLSDVSETTGNKNALVCVITGYRANGGSTDTNLTVLKAYVAAMNTDVNFNNPAKGTGCGEYAQQPFSNLYSEIADVCM